MSISTRCRHHLPVLVSSQNVSRVDSLKAAYAVQFQHPHSSGTRYSPVPSLSISVCVSLNPPINCNCGNPSTLYIFPGSPQDAKPVFEGFQQAGGVFEGRHVERDGVAVSEDHPRQGRQGGQDPWRWLPRVCRHRGKALLLKNILRSWQVLFLLPLRMLLLFSLSGLRCCPFFLSLERFARKPLLWLSSKRATTIKTLFTETFM